MRPRVRRPLLAAAPRTYTHILVTRPDLALLKPRGTLACVGLPEKDQKSQLWFQSVVPTERALVGSYLGPYADYDEMLEFAVKHGVKPQVEVMPLARINEALDRVRDGKARYRVVVEMPETE